MSCLSRWSMGSSFHWTCSSVLSTHISTWSQGTWGLRVRSTRPQSSTRIGWTLLSVKKFLYGRSRLIRDSSLSGPLTYSSLSFSVHIHFHSDEIVATSLSTISILIFVLGTEINKTIYTISLIKDFFDCIIYKHTLGGNTLTETSVVSQRHYIQYHKGPWELVKRNEIKKDKKSR